MRTIDQARALLAIKELEVRNLRDRVAILANKVRNLTIENNELNEIVASQAIKFAKENERQMGFRPSSK